MFIEIHILQNFAPSCLNRDDTNSPKECTFGGFRRARISSQCLKRAARTHKAFSSTVASGTGKRTKRVASEIADRLVALGHAEPDSRLVSEAALVVAGFKVEAETKDPDGADLAEQSGQTSVLLYVGDTELDALAKLCSDHFDALREAIDPKSLPKEGAKKRSLKVREKDLPKECTQALKSPPQATQAADIGLFGRMVAENRHMGIDAACQVAHALSTHAVEAELDFFTAVDDLNPKEDTGAGMMGIVEFNSACFYRYSLVDFEQLVANLGGDRSLARAATLGYLKATVESIPTGKQNSMAAHNPPEYVRVVLRSEGAPRSLANAFLQPIAPRQGSLMKASVEALRGYSEKLDRMYGDCDAIELEASLEVVPDPLSLPEIWSKTEEALA